ncbi:MAG: hypothetical protein JNJ71_09590 [Rubrivivax sp.]|nr:hypothetical protein [Rubrivivax sp.]
MLPFEQRGDDTLTAAATLSLMGQRQLEPLDEARLDELRRVFGAAW